MGFVNCGCRWIQSSEEIRGMQGCTTKVLHLLPRKSGGMDRQKDNINELVFCFKIYGLLYVLDRDLMGYFQFLTRAALSHLVTDVCLKMLLI